MQGEKKPPAASTAKKAKGTTRTPESTAEQNSKQAIVFLKGHSDGWATTSYLQVVAIVPDGPITAIAVHPDRIDELRPFIEQHNGKANLYFAPNPLHRDPGKKASKVDIAALAYHQVDLDPAVNESPEAAKQRHRKAVAALSIEPSTLIDSGNGLGAFWRLQEPIEHDGNTDALEQINRRLAQALGGDSCHNLDRIMRLPGTVNLPTATKREKGRVPVPATLIQQNAQAYSPDAFNFLPPASPKAVAVDLGDLDLGEIDELSLATRYATHQQHDPDLKLLLEGKAPAWVKDKKGSGLDHAYALTLKRLGYSRNENIHLVSKYEHGKTSRERDLNYLKATVDKFYAPKVQDAPSSHGFEAPYLTELWDDNLAVDWMIYGVLENKVIAEIWGPAGSYKSFTVFDMAIAITSGQDWHRHKVMRQGPVLYVPGEGGWRNITRRLKVLCQERGLGRDQKIRVSKMPVLMSKAEQYEFLREEIAGFDVPPALIIFDTLAKNFGGNENSAEDMGAFLDNLGKLSREFGATILIIHHCGHDSTHARGSYALFAGIDCEYQAIPDKGNKTLILKNIKMKDAEEGNSFYFDIKVVGLKNEATGETLQDDEGKPITSIVLSSSSSQYAAARDAFFKEHSVFKSKGQSKVEQRLPKVLKQARFHPESSDRDMAKAVDPAVTDHSWVNTMRGLLLKEGLVEGGRFRLTAEGEKAAIAFDSLVQMVDEMAKQIAPDGKK